ncbi:LysR family transcriptional regulator [Corynebacterium pseudodiphtheriticum]|uniref:LysR family transcriptional regulator n=1 Tax=Corynebacterium pseudodiphtheriticum TaxID=37637 RepID=UPI0025430B56|nr:LysR family transcriptional regulator [Corynebacterium pseudodiphtheriticum]MDK4242657.1 LysR family transcriptional regulator [Corynebacterium pseudodiphtheriticum]MDK4295659.1 LysR family transcriptional regulator [Corynebacterium pseudodiphtheriticum]
MLHLVFATGTEPGKWFQRFQRDTPHGLKAVAADDPFAMLADGANADSVAHGDASAADRCEVALMRLPDSRIDEAIIGREFHVVKLYTEQCGIAVPKDSVFAEVGEPVGSRDIEGEIINFVAEKLGPIDVDKLRESLQVVAANVGVTIGPLPLLKMLSKNQIRVLPYNGEHVGGARSTGGSDTEPTDGRSGSQRAVAQTEIALVWKVAADGDAIQDFVGIAKGRKAGSTRHRALKETRQKKRPGSGVGKNSGSGAGKSGSGKKKSGKATRARGQAPGGLRKKKRR